VALAYREGVVVLRAIAYAASAIVLAVLGADPAFVVGLFILARIELLSASRLSLDFSLRRDQR
jgi:hypothetical protein